MFGYVCASLDELTEEEKTRYNAIYCGICRRIRAQSSQLARLTLSYDMAFLAMLLMSLYEPEETGGDCACVLHPIRKKPWTDSGIIRYAADMNVALSYYQFLDDWQDEKSQRARAAAALLKKGLPQIQERYPRQCRAIAQCLEELSALEQEGCGNPDAPANAFGRLMGELFVWQEDLWSEDLRQMGLALGRFIYLADGAVDYPRDAKTGNYNPFLAMGMEPDWQRWEEYLVLAMARCTDAYERLPLVQDKAILDNILYSGVWVSLKAKRKDSNEKTEENHDH